MIRFARFAFLLLGFVAFVGCSESKSVVNGTITLDDLPVLNGSITFIKTEGELVREGAVIKDGGFKAELLPGKYKIEVNGQKVTGKRKQKGFDGTEEELEITQELFPERYNTKTELLEEIKPGPNVLKLELKSKP